MKPGTVAFLVGLLLGGKGIPLLWHAGYVSAIVALGVAWWVK